MRHVSLILFGLCFLPLATPARAVLTNRAPFFIIENLRSSNRFFDLALRSVWTVTKSQRSSSSSRLAY